jgi:hypothetical protein
VRQARIAKLATVLEVEPAERVWAERRADMVRAAATLTDRAILAGSEAQRADLHRRDRTAGHAWLAGDALSLADLLLSGRILVFLLYQKLN